MIPTAQISKNGNLPAHFTISRTSNSVAAPRLAVAVSQRNWSLVTIRLPKSLSTPKGNQAKRA